MTNSTITNLPTTTPCDVQIAQATMRLMDNMRKGSKANGYSDVTIIDVDGYRVGRYFEAAWRDFPDCYFVTCLNTFNVE